MTDTTADEKIERLVRSVLEAVDARLAEVRHEVHQLSADVERRQQEMLQHVQDLERKLESGAADASGTVGADLLAVRMEQATQVLLERIEAMHQRNTMATNERFALLDAAVEQLSGPALSGPDETNAPFRPAPITTEQAVLATPPPLQPTAVAPGVPHDQIDIDQLTSLLTERLGQMSLPQAPQ